MHRTSLEGLTQDLRFALRTMRRSPAVSAVAVLTLALGIGANTAIFSIVSHVLLRPLAYRDPDRLVTILQQGRNPVSPGDFLEWQKQSRSFEQMAAAGGWPATLTGRDHPEQIVGLQLTEGMFSMLGVEPLYGRTFLPEEWQPGKGQVVVLSFRLWQRRFGSDPKILGQVLTLNGAPYTVAGVMPPSFQFSPFWVTEAQMWSPLSLASQATSRGNHFLRVFARLKPGVSMDSAQTEMDTICARLAKTYPDTNAGLTVRVDPLKEKVVGNIRPALLVLLGAVGFVLLIACSNIANLALARAAERQREIGIRLALGASRARVFRQLLTENVLLSLAGGALGLALAFWGVDALKTLVQEGAGRYFARLPRFQEVGLDPLALGFTTLLAMVTGILSGLFPALQATRTDVNDSLKEGGRSSSEGGRSLRVRSVLVISEVAISLVLLAGAGLLVRSFLRQRAIDPGFDAHRLLTMTVSVAGQSQYTGALREALYHRIVQEVGALPGVQSASMINHLPVGGDIWGTFVFAEGQALPPPGQNVNSNYRVSRPGYFRTMGIPILRGRDFNERDAEGAPRVIIINEKLAQRFWPGEDPIGKRMTTSDPRNHPVWLTVAGVVRNVKQSNWLAEPDNEYYVPFLQDAGFLSGTHPWLMYMTLVVRTGGDPLGLAGAVLNRIWSIDKDAAVSDVRSLEQVISGALWQARFQLLVLGLFAGFALVLAAVGVYGVMAYSVSRRTHEIGIRMALGARRGAVIWLILRQGLARVAAGIGIGLAAAFAVTRSLSSLLYGVTATDPVTFAAIPLVLGLVALLASFLPARRASRVDPVVALRCE